MENCEWHLDDDEAGAWESACGTLWCFEDGDPKDNGMKFCPFCGRLLTKRPPDYLKAAETCQPEYRQSELGLPAVSG